MLNAVLMLNAACGNKHTDTRKSFSVNAQERSLWLAATLTRLECEHQLLGSTCWDRMHVGDTFWVGSEPAAFRVAPMLCFFRAEKVS